MTFSVQYLEAAQCKPKYIPDGLIIYSANTFQYIIPTDLSDYLETTAGTPSRLDIVLSQLYDLRDSATTPHLEPHIQVLEGKCCETAQQWLSDGASPHELQKWVPEYVTFVLLVYHRSQKVRLNIFLHDNQIPIQGRIHGLRNNDGCNQTILYYTYSNGNQTLFQTITVSSLAELLDHRICLDSTWQKTHLGGGKVDECG